MKPPLLLVVAISISVAICASLGWIGITEHHLTTGGKLGIRTSYGVNAVVEGWLWFATAFGFIGMLVSGSGFRNIIWLGLSLLYVVCLAIYWHLFYTPAL